MWFREFSENQPKFHDFGQKSKNRKIFLKKIISQFLGQIVQNCCLQSFASLPKCNKRGSICCNRMFLDRDRAKTSCVAGVAINFFDGFWSIFDLKKFISRKWRDFLT